MKFFIQTFGCQMNVADSNMMADQLSNRGMVMTDNKESADVIVLNTCSVRSHAELKALSYIGRLAPFKKAKPELKIIVTGCAAQRLGKELYSRFPIVDLVIGAMELDHLSEILDRSFPDISVEKLPDNRARGARGARAILPSRAKESAVTAFVTIMRGCQNFCSYCIVPYVRGPEKSRPAGEIVSEIKGYAADGYKDITLLGQNVNSYASTDGMNDFPGLLKLINNIKGIERIRFMTSHPKDLSDKLIDAMASLEKVCPHLHLPLQSGSDRILEAMNRKYTAAHYLSLIDKIRKRLPGASLTTDVLIGFPGETEDEFDKTLSLIKQIEFNSLFAFKYSPRAGTASFAMPETVSEEEKEKRHQRVLELAVGISVKKHAELVGTVQNALVEKAEGTLFTGRTRSNLKVFFSAPEGSGLVGKLVDVEITRSKINTLIGEMKKQGK
jgi:tRNA-2-methylthio-N6-dimethylallyladenosine synthase